MNKHWQPTAIVMEVTKNVAVIAMVMINKMEKVLASQHDI
jgi:hypothetical protein